MTKVKSRTAKERAKTISRFPFLFPFFKFNVPPVFLRVKLENDVVFLVLGVELKEKGHRNSSFKTTAPGI